MRGNKNEKNFQFQSNCLNRDIDNHNLGGSGKYCISSTNDINRVNGWAHVDEMSADVGEVTLEFISARGFYSCFEYLDSW